MGIYENIEHVADNFLIYHHFKDFSDQPYVFQGDFLLPSNTEEKVNGTFKLQTDLISEKISFSLNSGEKTGEFFIKNESILFRSSNLTQIYGVDLSNLSETWNDSNITNAEFPFSGDFSIFPEKPTQVETSIDFNAIFTRYRDDLLSHLEIKKVDSYSVFYNGQWDDLKTYSVYIDSVFLRIMCYDLVAEFVSCYGEYLLYYYNYYANFQKNVPSMTLTDLENHLKLEIDYFISAYNSIEQGGIFLSLKDNTVVQVTYWLEEQEYFLRFNDLTNLLSSITIQKGQDVHYISLNGSEHEVSFSFGLNSEEQVYLAYFPKETKNSLMIRGQGEVLLSLDVDSSGFSHDLNSQLLFAIGDDFSLLSQRKSLPDDWFLETEEYIPFFQMNLIEYLNFMSSFS